MSTESLRRVRLADVRELSSRVRGLVFEAEGPAPFAYEAGQWVMLRLRGADGAPLSRPYSIASAPGHAGANRFEVAVGASSDAAVDEALRALRVGHGLEVEATGGALTWRAARGGGVALLVGAGTGVAPLRALAQAALGRGEGRRVALLAGYRSRGEALWSDELAGWGDGLRVEVTLSQGDEGWAGRRGYVQEHVAELAREVGATDAFVCGRTAMATAVAERL
ncbi:MAG TPA: FAD-binding oxidoreductase, partial [Polyangiaceae bacterium]|nr:FAD-binding oxidoreductase [Polyangiaceae bacterium]